MDQNQNQTETSKKKKNNTIKQMDATVPNPTIASSSDTSISSIKLTFPPITSHPAIGMDATIATSPVSDLSETSRNQTNPPSNHATPDTTYLVREINLASDEPSTHTTAQSNAPDVPSTPLMPESPHVQPPCIKNSFLPNEMFQHYRIEKELGRGGMGVVYQVWDTLLQRRVALKLLLFSQSMEQKELLRFIQEAQVTAQLHHPNIIQVYEVGQNPQPYFTMEYIQGETLKSLIQKEKVPIDKLVVWVKACAEGLEVAHQKKIIHRDIKPANIMIADDNVPKLMDFGIAKKQDSQLTLTHPSQGELLGTPTYMSPEQADGKTLDGRSDVYSLGTTLYQGLTGRPPYQGDSCIKILYQLTTPTVEPVLVSTLNPSVSKDLEAICHKCLEKNPNKRYSNAKSLADDLQNYISKKPVLARPITAWTKTYKWIHRNRITALALFLGIVSIFTGIFVTTWQWLQVEQARANEQQQRIVAESALQQTKEAKAKAEIAQRKAEEETQNARHEFGTALLERAKRYENDKDYFSAKMLLARAIGFEGCGGPVENYPPLLKKDSEEWKEAVSKINFMPNFRPIWQSPISKQHKNAIKSISYSPDGKFIASGGNTTMIHIWNMATGQCQTSFLVCNNAVESVSYSPDGKFITTVSLDKTIRIWDIKTGQCQTTLQGHEDVATSVSYSTDGKFIASGSTDKTIRIWNTATGKSHFTLQGHQGSITSVSYSPDNKFIASGSMDKTIRIWNAATGQCEIIFKGHAESIHSVSYSPDGKFIASGSQDQTIRVWDIKTAELQGTLQGHQEAVTSLNYSPDGRFIVSGSQDQTIRIWDTTTGKCQITLQGHEDAVATVTYAPDGKSIASGSRDGSIRIWDVTANQCQAILHGHQEAVASIIYSPDGKFIASGSQDQTIRIWDATTSQCQATLQGHTSYIMNIAYSPDGKFLASGSCDKTIQIWNVATGQCHATLQGHEDNVHSISYSPDGRFIASGSSDSTIRIWEMSTGQCQIIPQGGQNGVSSVTYSPDGKFIASANGNMATSQDNVIRIWDVSTKQCKAILQGHKAVIHSVKYSPDGKSIASGSTDNTIRIWDVATGVCQVTLQGHEEGVHSISYHPSGTFLASASWDKTIRIWDTKTGECQAILQGHKETVGDVTYSPDGRLIASGSDDKTIRIWDVSSMLNYAQYVSIVQYRKLLVTRLSTISHGEENPALFFSPTPYSSMAILQSQQTEEEKNLLLADQYCQAENFSSAIILFQQCDSYSPRVQEFKQRLQAALFQAARKCLYQENDFMAQYRLSQWKSLGGTWKNINCCDEELLLFYLSILRTQEFQHALAFVQESKFCEAEYFMKLCSVGLDDECSSDDAPIRPQEIAQQWRYILTLSWQPRLKLTADSQATWLALEKEPGYQAALSEWAKANTKPGSVTPLSPSHPTPQQIQKALAQFPWQILAYYQNRMTEQQLLETAKKLDSMSKTLSSNAPPRCLFQFYFAMGLWHLAKDTTKAKQYLRKCIDVSPKDDLLSRMVQAELDLLK